MAVKGDFVDRTFTTLLIGHVKRSGYEVVAPQSDPGFIVAMGNSHYIGIVGSRASDKASTKRTYLKVKRLIAARPRLNEVVVVRSAIPSSEARDRLRNVHGVDVIELSEVRNYLDYRKARYAEPRKRASKASPTKLIKANADAIRLAAVSLEHQITAKIEELEQKKPNSDEAIEARDTAISEYEDLRDRVTALEQAIAKQREGKSKPSATAKVGNAFGATFKKWWAKSGPKVLDKGTDMGIVASGACILVLLGADPTFAAGIAGTVVTGKSLIRR